MCPLDTPQRFQDGGSVFELERTACSISVWGLVAFFQVAARVPLCCPRNQVLGSWAWLVPLAVALSTFGSVNGIFFSGSRVCYAAAREGHLVRDGSGARQGDGGCRRAAGRSANSLLSELRIWPKPGLPQ